MQQALEEDLLCPFHYFGITDLEVNGEVMDDLTVSNILQNLSAMHVLIISSNRHNITDTADRVSKGWFFAAAKKKQKSCVRSSINEDIEAKC